MIIIGYVGFVVLVFLAVTWTIGVRVQLEAGVHTIIGALFFVGAAIVLAATEANKLHSLWLIPGGFVLSMASALLSVHFSPVFKIIKYLASAFARVIRIGIPPEKVQAALDADLMLQVRTFHSKKNNAED